MYHIAIIGAGQLGSRHLQGLKRAQISMKIQVVDSAPQALEVAKERYEQVDANPLVETIDYLTAIDQLDPQLDLVIIATGSAPRAAILTELLTRKTVRNLLLEKVLFPGVAQYDAMEALLREKNLLQHTWVNCSRRMFVGYQKLRDVLCSARALQFEKSGANWGLGCNAVHYIDLLGYLSGGAKVEPFDVSGLDPQVLESKRPGYVEFTGTITSRTSRGDTLTITSSAQADAPNRLTVVADGVRYTLDEVADRIEKEGVYWNPVGMKFQSELTGVVAEDILLRGGCALTSYEESKGYHLAFLVPLVAFYNRLTGKNQDNCPIT